VWYDVVHCRTEGGENQTKIIVCKNVDFSALMKIELLKFDRSENLGINERFNLTKNVLAFAIRATCTPTW